MLCKYKWDFCLQVKNKPCVDYIVIMRLISWIHSRGSETSPYWLGMNDNHFAFYKNEWLTLPLTAVLGNVILLHVEQLAQQGWPNRQSECSPPVSEGVGGCIPLLRKGVRVVSCRLSQPSMTRRGGGGVGPISPTQCGCHRMRVNTE